MKAPDKTFYLWDLANTLFPEKWNKKKSGFENYDEYVESLGFDLKTISPRDYEWTYEIPYKEGLFNLSLAEGFVEVLSRTKNNVVLTTGNKEQIDWRAENLLPKYSIDIRDFLKEIHSTFDYGNTNTKTIKILENLIGRKGLEGFTSGVYTDDRLENCKFFLNAIMIAAQKGINIRGRSYNITNDSRPILQIEKNLFEIGSLNQLLDNEKLFL